jgi:hypothetical protein
MKVIKNEKTVFFDIDNTLVFSSLDPLIANLNPVTCVEVFDPINERFMNMVVHEPMVRLLREEHHRGSYVVVWSRGGYAWAGSVISALGLEKCVHEIMTKPMVYFDDRPIEEWLPYRVYLPPDMPYKK